MSTAHFAFIIPSAQNIFRPNLKTVQSFPLKIIAKMGGEYAFRLLAESSFMLHLEKLQYLFLTTLRCISDIPLLLWMTISLHTMIQGEHHSGNQGSQEKVRENKTALNFVFDFHSLF